MEIKKASRKSSFIKMAIQGPSGCGKTMSALLLAKGLVDKWQDIVVIDSENGSANLYAHLGEYGVVDLSAPYTPEKYMEAIDACMQFGAKAIVIDSISHEWDGSGGILDIHSNMLGNSFTNWSKVTPRHNAFVQKLLQSPAHIVCTIRTKQDYVLSEKNGKMVPEKVGLKGVTRDGIDYEFTIVFDVNIKHTATSSKDRTGLYMDKPEFVITEKTGIEINAWCEVDGITPFQQQITNCHSIGELNDLYRRSKPEDKESLLAFSTRKQELLKHHQNGSIHTQ